MKLQPNHHCEATSELLFGESVEVLDHGDLWSKIKSLHDGYEGFVETDSCDFSKTSTTHWVSIKSTYLFESPDIKAPIRQRVLFGSELALNDVDESTKFLRTTGNGFVWADHVLKKNITLRQGMVAIAQNNYLNVPYRWGGRSADGCDCSGLVQMVAMACGVTVSYTHLTLPTNREV